LSRTTFTLEARPVLPEPLRRLDELAGNLAYAWDRRIRAVFPALDAGLWRTLRSPPLLLQRLPQATLDRAAGDERFLELYARAVTALDARLAAPRSAEVSAQLGADDLVAYFCAEFGIHETLPIYSGGLGVLAGDHCKAASDLGLPLVAVGLLYRQGYFTQTLDAHGRQHAHAHAADFADLPVALCRDDPGTELRVQVEIAERQVQLRVWQAQVGRVPLVLLDSDLPENEPAERAITHQLYGGDADMRIRQEIVLGIGGLRALRALGHRPTVFHCNEGHAAFLVLERLREHVAAGADFAAALETVAASQVFTTHTPVAAGHDAFSFNQVRWNLRALLPQLGAPEERVLALGATAADADPGHDRFNMTTLALRGSRFRNGVSRVHGRVARRMEKALWPQLRTADVPIGHVTNGVHVPTFLAAAWAQAFDARLPGWRDHLHDVGFWSGLDRVDDQAFTDVRRRLKHALLGELAARYDRQLRRGGVPADLLHRALGPVAAGGDPLVLGFSRRFATYKRAALLLTDPDRLARLLGDSHHAPALLVFAGKAHPHDKPGQELIRRLFEASLTPPLIGRLLVLEGYDLGLARRLVQGCDAWLNTPEYPLEACGTSGMKAAINGTVNVSVLDGWWDEAWDPGADGVPNGFAIHPASLAYWGGADDAPRQRDAAEARQLFDLLEQQVFPRYFGFVHGYGPEWLRVARRSMQTLLPRYEAGRMVRDYIDGYYGPAARHGRALAADGAGAALAGWRARVLEAWPRVRLRGLDPGQRVLPQGAPVPVQALATLNGLSAQDVAVECEIGGAESGVPFVRQRTVALSPAGAHGSEQLFRGELPAGAGPSHYRVYVRPSHPALAHPFESGLAVWA
jgi:glycogen phosphorylase